MEKIQNKLLVFTLFIFCSINIYGSDIFEGIWRCHNTKDISMDSFLGIEAVGDEEYFIIYVDPFNEHQFDFASYGYIDEEGYLVVDTGKHAFYFELYDDISLYQNWNITNDMNAYRYTRILESSINELENPYVDFGKFIESAVEGTE